jgi:hypothetical protein
MTCFHHRFLSSSKRKSTEDFYVLWVVGWKVLQHIERQTLGCYAMCRSKITQVVCAYGCLTHVEQEVYISPPRALWGFTSSLYTELCVVTREWRAFSVHVARLCSSFLATSKTPKLHPENRTDGSLCYVSFPPKRTYPEFKCLSQKHQCNECIAVGLGGREWMYILCTRVYPQYAHFRRHGSQKSCSKFAAKEGWIKSWTSVGKFSSFKDIEHLRTTRSDAVLLSLISAE